MARIRSKVTVRAFDNSTELDTLFAPNDVNAENISDVYTRTASGKFRIQPGNSFTLPFETIVSPSGVFIAARGNFNLTINGAASPLAMIPINTTLGTLAKFYMDATVTSAVVANPGSPNTAVLEGWFFLWGDTT